MRILTAASLACILMVTARPAWTQTPPAAAPGAAAFARGVELADGGRPADAIPYFKDAVAQGFQPIFQGHFRLARAYAKAGQDVARLEGIGTLKLDFRVPEAYVGRLKAGQQVTVLVDAYPGKGFAGGVYAIEPGVDEQTRTVLLRARVANAELRLRPGMFARVQVQLGVREKAVWVPEAAIVPRGQDLFVFRVLAGPDGSKVELVKVQVGTRKIGEVEIVKGIAGGDLVVTEGTQKIGPGSLVVLSKEESKK